MRTVHCPLCGLRYAHPSELDAHVRDEHAPKLLETRETVRIPRRRPVTERPLDQVLRRQGKTAAAPVRPTTR